MARYRQGQGKEMGMRHIREALRLGLSCGVSSRDIGRSLKISHFSAQKYLRIAHEAGLDWNFVQDNVSLSRRGALRGLHFQNPAPQGKLVFVLQGEVFDVAVDLRRSSPNFGKWVGVVLSADNHRQLWVPPGFAHGFVVTSDSAEFLYKTTDYWYPEFERSLLWNDQTVGVVWPIDGLPQLAAKDVAGKTLAEAEVFMNDLGDVAHIWHA